MKGFLSWNLSVLDDLLILLKTLIPTFKGWVLMGIGATIGGWLNWALGGIDAAIIWLFIFTIIDFLSGNAAAIKQKKWQSRVTYKGIFKKLFIFIMIAICHGVDVSLQVDFVRTACIFAYILNEVGSILENVERLGFGDIIPKPLRNALHMVNEREQNKLSGIGAPTTEQPKGEQINEQNRN